MTAGFTDAPLRRLRDAAIPQSNPRQLTTTETGASADGAPIDVASAGVGRQRYMGQLWATRLVDDGSYGVLMSGSNQCLMDTMGIAAGYYTRPPAVPVPVAAEGRLWPGRRARPRSPGRPNFPFTNGARSAPRRPDRLPKVSIIRAHDGFLNVAPA